MKWMRVDKIEGYILVETEKQGSEADVDIIEAGEMEIYPNLKVKVDSVFFNEKLQKVKLVLEDSRVIYRQCNNFDSILITPFTIPEELTSPGKFHTGFAKRQR